ncbi:hypothetical protein HanRHA438_Chr13g0605211 [Helianthus annuus]|nr:hypothetical protein HanIR_Chr13g0646871 [Helianthus annuus]KAJ0858796.1 hypothetical protein HanRHA438_Chr13g0605211 [Helianthus annuus]
MLLVFTYMLSLSLHHSQTLMFLCYTSTQLFSNNLYTKCKDHISIQLFSNNLHHFINHPS